MRNDIAGDRNRPARVLEASVAQRLHRPLIGDVRTRSFRSASMLRYREVGDPMLTQKDCRRSPCGTRTDNQDLGFDVGTHTTFPPGRSSTR